MRRGRQHQDEERLEAVATCCREELAGELLIEDSDLRFGDRRKNRTARWVRPDDSCAKRVLPSDPPGYLRRPGSDNGVARTQGLDEIQVRVLPSEWNLEASDKKYRLPLA
jgi:hypothetical protein